MGKIGRRRKKTTGKIKHKSKIPCPLCGSPLYEGEKIHSIAFDAGKEKLMHIYGCPNCEKPESGIERRCPVCRRVIGAGGFVVGRMWDRQGKLHLHITGCTECKPQYKPKDLTSLQE